MQEKMRKNVRIRNEDDFGPTEAGQLRLTRSQAGIEDVQLSPGVDMIWLPGFNSHAMTCHWRCGLGQVACNAVNLWMSVVS